MFRLDTFHGNLLRIDVLVDQRRGVVIQMGQHHSIQFRARLQKNQTTVTTPDILRRPRPPFMVKKLCFVTATKRATHPLPTDLFSLNG